MSLATVLFGAVLIYGVLQVSIVEGRQPTTAEDGIGVSVSFGNLKARRVQVGAAPGDGEEIQGGFTPLPPLGPSEYVSSRVLVIERPPLKKTYQFYRFRPKPITTGPFYRIRISRPINYRLSINPIPRPHHSTFFYRYI